MSKKTEHKTNSEKDFLGYSANEMTEQERNAFEKNLQKDVFEEEAIEGLSSLPGSLLTKDLSELGSRISSKSRSRRRFNVYQLAAGLAVLVCVSSLFYYIVYQRIDRGQGTEFISETTNIPGKEEAQPEVPGEMVVEPLEKPGDLISPEKNEKEKREAGPEGNQINARDRVGTKTENILVETPEDEENIAVMRTENLESIQAGEAPEAAKTAAGKSSPGVGATLNSETAPKKFRGKIVSAENYKPLTGVAVSLKGEDETVNTDTGGYFEISGSRSPGSPSILELDYNGMEKLELQAESGPEMNIVMNPVYQSEEKVVIEKATARKAAAAEKNTEYNLSVIDAAPLKGIEFFEKFILDNQRFPETNTDITNAKVVLEFLVDKSGKLYRIKIVESPGKEFSAEAIRLLEEGPLWTQAVPPSHFTRIIIALEKH